jgi:hypothetical protein
MDNACLTLESNKYLLNKPAIDLLEVEYGDTIDIKYKNKDKKIIPVIGSSKNWGTKAGNKLTKSSSVSYRGVNNTALKEYGEVFSFEPWEGKEGLFVLVGDAETDTDDSDIDVTTITNESDKDLNNEEDEDLSFDDLNDIDADDNELKDFDFSI